MAYTVESGLSSDTCGEISESVALLPPYLDPSACIDVDFSDYELISDIPVTEVPVQLTTAHRAARKCQGKLGEVAQKVKFNIAMGRDAARGTNDLEAREIHQVASDVHRNFPEFCGRHCLSALLGVCPVAEEEFTAIELVHFIAGETPPAVKGNKKTEHTTTPVLQITDRILSTTLLDKPTNVRTIVMNGTLSSYQLHVLETELGKRAKAAYQPSFSLEDL